jgi:integrase/recombinase XerD
MCRLSLETGLRISELINVKIENIDWNTGRTHIKEGKGGQDRILYINGNLLSDLDNLRNRCGYGNTGYLFTTRSGKPYDRRNLDRMIKHYGQKAGILKRLHFHMFRHTYATKVLKETGNLRITQKVLGHRNISNTVIYTHLTDEDVQNVMAKSLYWESISVFVFASDRSGPVISSCGSEAVLTDFEAVQPPVST